MEDVDGRAAIFRSEIIGKVASASEHKPWGMYEFAISDPGCVKTRMLRFAGAAGWLMKPSLCSDRFY
jgi:hypothetical protein